MLCNSNETLCITSTTTITNTTNGTIYTETTSVTETTSEFYDVAIDWRDLEKKLGPRLPCDNGWVSFGSHCINVNLDKMGWNEAEGQCKNRGGHLVSIRSVNVNTFMTSVFNSKLSIELPMAIVGQN